MENMGTEQWPQDGSLVLFFCWKSCVYKMFLQGVGYFIEEPLRDWAIFSSDQQFFKVKLSHAERGTLYGVLGTTLCNSCIRLKILIAALYF